MKLLFASDSFKGSLTSAQTAELLTKAAQEVFPGCICDSVPVADGGEGTVDAVIAAQHGRKVTATVHDPLMRQINAAYGVLDGNRAVIEMSAASGLPLISEAERDPLRTTTYGTGELIRHALDSGCRAIAVAIGGSATNDGGMGCLRALGARFLSADGTELTGCGRDLGAVSQIDLSGLDSRFAACDLTVMCDVKNPLCGENGATNTYARQKGASDADCLLLESGMQHYRDVIKRTCGVDCDRIEGSGAAGGLGAALHVFCGGVMRSGIETVLDWIGFDERLSGVDLVVTGEGRADWQSCSGKVMQGVGLRAKARGVPAVGLCGSLGEGALALCDSGISSLMTTVNAPMTLAQALQNAEQYYYEAAVRLFRFLKTGMALCDKKHII